MVWIAGRVDSQCVPFVLLACVLALDGRQGLALVARSTPAPRARGRAPAKP